MSHNKIFEIPDSHFQRDPAEITSEEISVYYKRQELQKARYPPLSTISFPCPSCDAETKAWCRDEQGREAEGICEARKAIYRSVYDRYFHKVKNGSLKILAMTDAEIKKEIQKLIEEVIQEYD